MSAATPTVHQALSPIRVERFPRDDRPEDDSHRGLASATERVPVGRSTAAFEPHGFANAGPDCYWEVLPGR